MADVITGPEVKEFNPATLVYKNENGDKVLTLDAKMAWFHHLKPGWRITIDGLRVFGMEVYVNNTYESPNEPGKFFSRREKEIVYQAVGFISMLDAKSVRVASVPMNIDASDPDFCGKLFEDGAEFLLDFCGFNVYNITKEQWEAAMESRITAGRNNKPAVNAGNQGGYGDYGYEDNSNVPQQQSQYTPEYSNSYPQEHTQESDFFDGLLPNTPPASVDSGGDPSTFDFTNEFAGMQHANVIPSDPDDEDELSVNNMLKLYDQYNQLQKTPVPKEELQTAFERFCIFLKGNIYTEMDINDKNDVYNSIKKMIKSR